jgi:hypothetical protein
MGADQVIPEIRIKITTWHDDESTSSEHWLIAPETANALRKELGPPIAETIISAEGHRESARRNLAGGAGKYVTLVRHEGCTADGEEPAP